MDNLPLIRVNSIAPVIGFLDQLGASTQQYLRRAKLSDAVLDEPEALVSLYHASDFIELAAQREAIPLLGVLASQQGHVSNHGLFGAILSQSLTGYDLLQTISQLMPRTYSSGVRVWLSQDDTRVWLNHQPSVYPSLGYQQVQYYACLRLMRVVQLIATTHCRVTDLHLQTSKLPELSESDMFAGVRVRFNQPYNSIGFAKQGLYLPLKQPMQLPQTNSDELYERLYSTAPADDFLNCLRQFIYGQLPSGHLQIEVAAEALSTSVRSLQRQLHEEGLSYSHLVDQVRFDRAVELLKDPTIQMGDIAFQLGYTKPANFTRAFLRWAGVSPREFRRLHFLTK